MKKAVRIAEILQYASAAHQQGRLAEAERSYASVLDLKRDEFNALHLLGVLRWQQQRFDEAAALIRQALRVKPDSAEACSNLGIVLQSLGRPAEALALYDRALSIDRRYVKALFNRGNALRALARGEEALESYDKAIAASPNYFDAIVNRGVVLRDLNRPAEALMSFKQALALRPDNRELVYNRANALHALGRLDEALADYDAILAADPAAAEAHNNRGCVLEKLGRFDEAIESFDRALALAPADANVHHNRGNVLLRLGRYDDAIASCEAALANAAQRPDTLHNRGTALMLLRRYDEAADAFDAALHVDPSHADAAAGFANCQLIICNWDKAAHAAQEAEAAAQNDDWSRFDPFCALCYLDDPARHLAYARDYVHRKIPAEAAADLPAAAPRASNEKIRVAYLSADFCSHPVASASVRLFELHDRARFDVIGISFGPDDGSVIRARIAGAFDEFHDVRLRSDRDIARLMRERGIDIALDLNGHTRRARPGILARRPAPVQVSYLGFPGTTGAGFIDYVIADATVLPAQDEPFFSERVVRLPGCYHLSDETREIAPDVPPRAELGLPDDTVVLCCFNRSDKIVAPIFSCWMRLLARIPGSVLWLSQLNEPARENLRRAAAAQGIEPQRLIFAPRTERMEDHLARHRQADLFLDTLPYNAHSTAIDALWAGLPVVTCRGGSFAGRVGASVLTAAGLPELVTQNLDAYEELAVTLANDRARLDALRRRLDENRQNCALFDMRRTCRHIEAAYQTMRDIALRGEPPCAFDVAPRL